MLKGAFIFAAGATFGTVVAGVFGTLLGFKIAEAAAEQEAKEKYDLLNVPKVQIDPNA